MKGTLVNEKNKDMFLPVLGMDSIGDNDLIVGVIDDETGTACGVLHAESVAKNELDIRTIFVEESFRNKGAGKELVRFFVEISQRLGVSIISCSYIYREENNYLYRILDESGFADVSSELSMYAVKLSDLFLRGAKLEYNEIRIEALENLSDDMKATIKDMDISGCREDISFVAIVDGRVSGGFIFRQLWDMLEIVYLDAEGSNREKILYLLYHEVITKTDEVLDPDTWILMNLSTPELKEKVDDLSAEAAIEFHDYIMFILKLNNSFLK